jgi:hypothetical protein
MTPIQRIAACHRRLKTGRFIWHHARELLNKLPDCLVPKNFPISRGRLEDASNADRADVTHCR